MDVVIEKKKTYQPVINTNRDAGLFIIGYEIIARAYYSCWNHNDG